MFKFHHELAGRQMSKTYALHLVLSWSIAESNKYHAHASHLQDLSESLSKCANSFKWDVCSHYVTRKQRPGAQAEAAPLQVDRGAPASRCA